MKQLSALVVSVGLLMAGCATHFSQKPSEHSVKLYLFEPLAEEALFYSSANGFNPQKMQKNLWNYWTVKVDYYKQFTYFYVVDGEVVVPECDLREQDDFGKQNCIYYSGPL